MASAQVDGLFGRRSPSLAFSKSVASSSPLILGAYVIYEPDADGGDAAALASAELPPGAMDAAGRFVPYWYIDSGPGGDGTLKLKPNTEMETLEYYVAPKSGYELTGKASPTLTEPYLYEGVRMVSHTYPIVMGRRFVGITGIDRSHDMVSRLAEGIRARLGTDVFVVSAGGRIIATTADAAGGSQEAGQLGFRELHASPYAPLAERWRATNDGGGVFEAVDPVLHEPCIYATCPVRAGGWSVIVRRTVADAMGDARAGLVRNVVMGCIGSAVIGALLLLLFRAVGRRVRTAADAADRIARGDLTQPIAASRTGDETGTLLRSMDSMHGHLNDLVGSVRSAGVGLGAVALEISAASGREEASASALGSAAAQIAAAVTEISSTGRELAGTMDAVSANATQTAELAGAGRAGLEAMALSMRELELATGSIDEKLGTIRARSQTITKVVGTITGVADRTNVLSINAAIEAQKAGTFGAGFRVISAEIGRLANETAQATLDIEAMVEQMQAAVSSGVDEMGRYSDRVGRRATSPPPARSSRRSSSASMRAARASDRSTSRCRRRPRESSRSARP
jgi:methyl-accepting chemotaxis protein